MKYRKLFKGSLISVMLFFFSIATPLSVDAATPQFAAGYYHTVALKTNGTLWAWGDNTYSQLGDGTYVNKGVPTQVGSNAKWSSVAAGYYHTVALKSDGTLWAWGRNTYGQLGDGTTVNKNSPVQIGSDTDWSSISAGNRHTVAIKTDGTLWAWGENLKGQLGDGTTVEKTSPVQIGSDTTWSVISTGSAHTLALKSDGTLWSWGYNSQGQLGDGTSTNNSAPIQIGSDTTWSTISAGGLHSVAIKSDGTLWSWGDNIYGQLGIGSIWIERKSAPTLIRSDTTWSAISAGGLHTLATKSDGTLWSWGHNNDGRLGDGTHLKKVAPVQVGSGTAWSSVAAGGAHTLGLKSDGMLWSWGDNSQGQLGNGRFTNKSAPAQIGSDTIWSDISAGGLHTLATKSDGTLWSWGDNYYGQLGDATNVTKGVPTQIGSDTTWSSVTAAPEHTFGLKSDGTLWAWGNNSIGQLGDGLFTRYSVPIQIGSDTTWSTISAGGSHSAAIKSDGTLWAWGRNNNGQLGDGTTVWKTSPIQIGSDTDWSSVSASSLENSTYTIALKTNGTLWGWGHNSYHQLGDGTFENHSTPVQIDSGTTWSAIAVGAGHTIALKSDGTLWSMGSNFYGTLGDGTTSTYANLAQVGSDTTWSAISAGEKHTLALKSDGTLWSWGDNSQGQLGDGTFTSNSTPTQIGSDTTWSAISAGGEHTLALKSDGTLWSWGRSTEGQLGDWVIRPEYTVDLIENTPVATVQTISAYENIDKTITLVGTDADSDPLSYIITALPSNGKLYQTTDGLIKGDVISSVPATVSDATHRVIYVSAANGSGAGHGDFAFKVNDGMTNSIEAMVTVNVMAINDAPYFTGIPAITGIALEGQTLSLSDVGAADADTDAVILSYQWKSAGSNIIGATSASYVLTAAEDGMLITCIITADDGQAEDNSTVTITTLGVTALADTDLDGVPNINDAFPTDPNGQTDSDNDSLPDEWEMVNLGGITETASMDSDTDGLTNMEEYRLGTEPQTDNATLEDTDSDGLPDTWEVANFGNLTLSDGTGDYDSDGISDIREYFMATSPRIENVSLQDTDTDGIPDMVEEANGTNPNIADATSDPDGDGLTNLEEYYLGSGMTEDNRLMTDTDSDGIPDLTEIAAGLDPLADNSVSYVDYMNGMLPMSVVDNDSDGLPDVWEIANGLDPALSNSGLDSDFDGILDVDEYTAGSSPMINLPPAPVTATTTDGFVFTDAGSVLLEFGATTDPEGEAVSYIANLYEGFDTSVEPLETDNAVIQSNGYSPMYSLAADMIYSVVIKASDGNVHSAGRVVRFIVSSGTIAGDVNYSGNVDGYDLVLLSVVFGKSNADSTFNPFADIDVKLDVTGDGIIDGDDLAVLAPNFGLHRP